MTLANARHAVALARAVDLLRKSPEPGEPQKAALHALVALAAQSSATFRFYAGELTVDGWVIPIADPRLAEFAKRLAAQDVAEIVIAQGAGPDEMLALARGLAADPGQGRIKEKLRDAGSTRIMVVMHQPLYGAQGQRSVAEAFEKVKQDEALTSQWNRFLETGAKAESERMASWGPAVRGGGEAAGGVSPAPDAAPAAKPPAVVPPATVAPAAPRPVAPLPQVIAEPLTLRVESPLGVALASFVADPLGGDTLGRLTQLSRQVQDAFSQGRVAEAIDAVSTLVDLEEKTPDPRVRSHYSIVFGRILTRASLDKAAAHLLEPRRRDRVATVLRRSPELAADLLVNLLTAAHTLGERVQYVALLRDLPQGTDRLLTLISKRTDWQLARNLAEAIGEVRVEAAVPYLARFLEYHDERLRRVALVAMAKIGSAATIEPLREVLRSAPPELRSVVVASIGAQARPLAGLVADHAERERNPDIIRECFRALGRIGTPEAIDALERAAGRRATFSRRNRAARATAEEVLRALGRGEPPQAR